MAMTTEAGKYAGVDFTYDQVGRLNSISRTANGDPSTTINTSYTLDLLDRVTTITHRKVAGEVATTLSAFTYGYDANGRVASYTGPEGSLSFAVDANGQLLSVTGARSEAFAFDPNGNRSSSTTRVFPWLGKKPATTFNAQTELSWGSMGLHLPK